MTNGSGSDRLDRIENALERLVGGLENTKTNIDRLNVGLEETRAIANSNSRSIQAILEQQATDRLRHEERMEKHDREIAELKAISSRLTEVQTGMARMLGKIDENNPTVLRRLMNIEDKVDRILERGEE